MRRWNVFVQSGIDLPLVTEELMRKIFAMLAIASALGAAATAQAHNGAAGGPVSGQGAGKVQLAQGGGGGGGSSGSSGAATMPLGGAGANPQDQRSLGTGGAPAAPVQPGETPTNNPPRK